MAEQRDVLVFYDERLLAHEPDANASFLAGRLDTRIRGMLSSLNIPWAYPEHPGRLRAIRDLLDGEPIPGVRLEAGAAATREQLGRVHTTHFLDSLDAMRGENAWVDMDTTAVSPGSVDAAEVAAGTAIAAVEAAVQRRADSAFAVIRPPGHHAEPARARGFCLLNNVAVAATHAQAALGCDRVLILDWDAHHGNGTQTIFWADPSVMFFDIHRAAPFYPGSGHLEEVGAGLGEGTTVNVPLPGGSGDAAYLKTLREILAPAAEFFKPDAILVSAGFDVHWHDLALNVSHAGFSAMAGVVHELARRHCDGRLAFFLEGGYNLESLPWGVHSVLTTLAGDEPVDPVPFGIDEVEAAARYHVPAFASEYPGS